MPPPPIDRSSKLWPGNNPRYKFLAKDGESLVPVHESLKDVMKRSSVYWDEVSGCPCGSPVRSQLTRQRRVHLSLFSAILIVSDINKF